MFSNGTNPLSNSVISNFIDSIQINGVKTNFIVSGNAIRFDVYKDGHKPTFFNTYKYGFKPRVIMQYPDSLGNLNLIANWKSNYVVPTTNDSVIVKVFYNNSNIRSYALNNNVNIFTYHGDPRFSFPNFKPFRNGLPYSVITPTDVAWPVEFIDIRFVYPNLNFTNRVDSLAYLK
jgi:hypothetical protein